MKVWSGTPHSSDGGLFRGRGRNEGSVIEKQEGINGRTGLAAVVTKDGGIIRSRFDSQRS